MLVHAFNLYCVPPLFFAVLPLLIPVKLYEAILAPRLDENLLQYRHLHDLSLAQFHSPICCEFFLFVQHFFNSLLPALFSLELLDSKPEPSRWTTGAISGGPVVVGDD